MAKRAREPEILETDRVAGFAHPREADILLGQAEPLELASTALRGGRPPHAWLLTGPPGIGKATLAYRMARYLLRYGATTGGPADLSVPKNDPVSMQITARAHPGLLVLKRGINPKTDKPQTELPVDEIRRLAGFFGMTSGAGGWRVAIVDPADDMNENAANALLKQLEEPPERAMLILLSHRPGRLLPTIRSRCRKLELRPLTDELMEKSLAHFLPDVDAAERHALGRLSGGSIGAALTLADGDGAMLAQEADKLLEQGRDPDVVALCALGEKIGRIRDGVSQFGDFLLGTLSTRVRARARVGGGQQRWAMLAVRLEEHFSRADGLNLEPRQTVLSAARMLSSTARKAGPL
jgi:DNA polymerase III subunit delta'